MKIVLGSTSQEKQQILKKALQKFGIKSEILVCEVDSGIAEQPLDEETTILGAVNRAKGAYLKNKDVDMSIGLEGGLVKIGKKHYYLICVAAVLDNNKKIHLGVSSKLKIPDEVSASIGKGASFGQAIRSYAETQNNPKIKKYVEQLITREEAFLEAIKNALVVREYSSLDKYKAE